MREDQGKDRLKPENTAVTMDFHHILGGVGSRTLHPCQQDLIQNLILILDPAVNQLAFGNMENSGFSGIIHK